MRVSEFSQALERGLERKMTLRQVEQAYILEALVHSQFRVKRTADLLGMSESGLHKKMKKFNWENCEVSFKVEPFLKKGMKKA